MLKQKIQDDLKSAMKAGDVVKRDTLRMLDSMIKNSEIEKKKREDGLSDEEIIEVAFRAIKQRRDSISQYEAGGRKDLAEKEKEADIAPGVTIQGKVRVEKGSYIGGKSLIRGPVIIGKNCVIQDSYIGPYTSIGDNVRITNTEIENSIILERAEIKCGKRIVDSLVGHSSIITASGDSLPWGHKLIVGDNSVVEL